eukprot:TRINITY_DN5254_c0_g1_i2.p1 TRINITY_DN5254_c0_g1~~TRINITY_DN5254_c0_g1_i2.p1  ORF type:complete len:283 (+),score=79.27 TRINITY_DN5254_c0_g1_i2:56-904(+)
MLEQTRISSLEASFLCSSHALIFVLSLYIWCEPLSRSRDDIQIVKKRLISANLAWIVSLFLNYFYFSNLSFIDFLVFSGFKTESFLLALILPLFLVIILFLGPILMIYFELGPNDFITNLVSIFKAPSVFTLRNIIVAPIAEEIVFRGCMCPLIIAAGFSPISALFMTPLFFGIAHLHHILNSVYSQQVALKQAVFEAVFQLFYTTLFGWFASFIFLRTGHIIGCIICHAFCNSMGFPQFDEINNYKQASIIKIGFIIGMIGFSILLMPLTNQSIFNSIFWQ